MRVERWKRRGEDLSATWEIPEIPGLWVYKEPEGWVIGYKFYHPNPQAVGIAHKIGGSYFRTRREALDAVKAAWLVEQLKAC